LPAVGLQAGAALRRRRGSVLSENPKRQAPFRVLARHLAVIRRRAWGADPGTLR
jgi:hypothetical protein